MAQASMGYGARPVHWIRFDPDAFKVDGTTLHTTTAKREELLFALLKDAISNADCDHFITVSFVCYDRPALSDTDANNLLQTFKFASIQAYEAWVETETPPDGVQPASSV